jgi:predicted membrane-bound spermidine synthase
MALGSCGRQSFKPPRAILATRSPGLIGVIALVFHVFVFVAKVSTRRFTRDGQRNARRSVWTAAAVLSPQSILLGMTFPLMSSGILRRYPNNLAAVLMLYFTNSIGAAIGVLASGFWMIGLFGLPGTIMTAGLLNIALALVVWTLVKLDPRPIAAPLRPTSAVIDAQPDGLAVLFFFAAALTGASSFMYEIGWIRMLSLVLGSTTHSFELMLSAFITASRSVGVIKRRVDGIRDPIRFRAVRRLMGVLAISRSSLRPHL